jgi:hypothetical protein
VTATYRRGWALGLLLVVVACGDDSGGDGSDGGPGDSGPADRAPTFEELPQLVAEKICVEVEACLDERSLTTLFGADGCVRRLVAQIQDSDFVYLEDAIEAGRVSYDGSQIEACLDQFAGIGCDFATTRIFDTAACRSAIGGSAQEGDECTVDEECTGETFCQLDSCPGTCTPRLTAGDPCEDDDQCEDGLTCADDDTCSAPAEAGDACGGGVAGSCAAGLFCVGEDEAQGTAGTCREYGELFQAGLGDACDFNSGELCADGLSCVVTALGADGNAQLSCVEPSDSGAACNFGAPSPCPGDEYCDADIATGMIEGTCQPLPGAGERCIALPGSPDCEPGLVCEADGRCHPVNRLGQPCASNDGCASRLCVGGNCERPEACEP